MLHQICKSKAIASLKKYHIINHLNQSSVQSLSHVWLFATPWTAACQAFLSLTNSRSLPKLVSIESVMPSNHLILSSCLQSFPASGSFPVSQFLTWVLRIWINVVIVISWKLVKTFQICQESAVRLDRAIKAETSLVSVLCHVRRWGAISCSWSLHVTRGSLVFAFCPDWDNTFLVTFI